MAATLAVEIAFGSTYQTASPTWTDVTAYVLDARTRRGRARKQAGVEPGTVTLTVYNADDRFTPGNPASPYAPNVIPGVPVRIRKQVASVWYTVAFGYVDSWQPQWTSRPATCVISAFDLLREAEIAGNMRLYRDRVLDLTPTWYWTLDQFGNSNEPVDISGNGYHGNTGSDWPQLGRTAGIVVGETGTALDATQLVDGEELKQQNSGAKISGTQTYTVAFLVDTDGAWSALTGTFFDERASSSNGIVVWPSGGVLYVFHGAGTLSESALLREGLNHICVVRRASAHELWVNGELADSDALSPQSYTAADAVLCDRFDNAAGNQLNKGILAHVALWRGVALSQAQIEGLSDAAFGLDGQLAGDRTADVLSALAVPASTVDTGFAALKPRDVESAASELEQAAVADGGLFFQEGDGTARFLSGLRVPPTPRLAAYPAFCVGYWTMDETAGTSIGDDQILSWNLTVGPFNGTITGGYTLGQASLLACYPDGKSIDFNGSTGYIYVADAAAFDLANLTNRLACGAWIRPDNVSSTRGIIARSDASAVDWSLYISSAGKVVFEIVNTGGTTRSVTGATTLTVGTTYHVLGIWDGTYLRVYVNGVLDGTSASYAGQTIRASSRQIWIGRRTSSYFDGRIAHAWFGVGDTLPDQAAFAAGVHKVGRPDWTFDIGTDLPYESAVAVVDDEQLTRTVRVTPYEASGTTPVPVELSNSNVRGQLADVTLEAYDSNAAAWTKAATLLERFGTARLTVTELAFPVELDDTNLWPVVVGVEIGDRVLVSHTTPGGVTVDTAGWVTALEHEISTKGLWATRLQIEP